jgi:hypothetical protein
MTQNRIVAPCVECGEKRPLHSKGRCLRCLSRAIRRERKEAESPVPGLDRSQHRDHEILGKTRQVLAGIFSSLLRMDKDCVVDRVISREYRELMKLICQEAFARLDAAQPIDDSVFEHEVVATTSDIEVVATTLPEQPEDSPYQFPNNPRAKSTAGWTKNDS